MQLGISLSGQNDSLKNLNDISFIIKKDFTGELIENGKRLRDKAKEILEGKVNPIYSIGKLRDSIKMEVPDRNHITVGPDGSAKNEKGQSYDEWVEFGHYMVGGWAEKGKLKKGARWWEGHHYMEGAWLEISPHISQQISDTMKLSLNSFDKSGKNIRHRTTGRYIKGAIN